MLLIWNYKILTVFLLLQDEKWLNKLVSGWNVTAEGLWSNLREELRKWLSSNISFKGNNEGKMSGSGINKKLVNK